MKLLLTIVLAAAAFMLPHSAQSQDKVRFPELGPEQLTPEQKKWADAVAVPPKEEDVPQLQLMKK